MTQLPLLALKHEVALRREEEEEVVMEEVVEMEEDVDALLPVLSWPPVFWPSVRPPAPPLDPGRPLAMRANEVLDKGGLSITTVSAGSRVYALLVDVFNMKQIASFDAVKGLVADWWIVTSNSLTPIAGRLSTPEAVVRALVQLLARRFLQIQQLGPVREVLTLLNFVFLASALMRATGQDESVAAVLRQIASVPILIYTALAKVVVARAEELREWLAQLPSDAADSPPRPCSKGVFGKRGQRFVESWNRFLYQKGNDQLRAFVRRNAVANVDRTRAVLRDFARNA